MDISFIDDAMQVNLTDGRQIIVPLEWFPKLRDASPEQRQTGASSARHRYTLPELDEDVSLEGMLS